MIAGVLLGRFLPVMLILVNIANKTVKWFSK